MWHIVYSFAGSTYSVDFKAIPGQTGTEIEMRHFLSRRNPTWTINSVEWRGPVPDDPGPQGAEGEASGN